MNVSALPTVVEASPLATATRSSHYNGQESCTAACNPTVMKCSLPAAINEEQRDRRRCLDRGGKHLRENRSAAVQRRDVATFWREACFCEQP